MDTCLKILDDCGYLPNAPIALVRVGDIPDGMSAAETERYLRDNGASLCGPAMHPDRLSSKRPRIAGQPNTYR
jgi:hypothetical protein